MKYSKMMQRLHLCRETSSRIEEDSENKKSHLVCVVPPPPPSNTHTDILRSAFNFSERKQVGRTKPGNGKAGVTRSEGTQGGKTSKQRG